ncbi:agip90 [Agrotis ipsilon multiple nucleopolyhedrovirus]|uniref:RING-type domain-containing protein n=1 Tax=Agrotis ipsilon multiple nucleopolyhedrovirus TaxID=208013 RepID=B6D604_9ABAC|nr:agip90 [Agrotis ipsilon multiple nucleopolyhedrovirus]ACI28791.1 unknown [Agrotis ipsilon multiple nucleopolyhedrovirus]
MSRMQTDVPHSGDDAIRAGQMSSFVYDRGDDSAAVSAALNADNNNSYHRYLDADDGEDGYSFSDDEDSFDIWTVQTVPADRAFDILRIMELFDHEMREDEAAVIETYRVNDYDVDFDENDAYDDEEEERAFVPRNLFLVTNKQRNETPIINDVCCICLEKLEDVHANDDKQISQIEDCQHGFCSDCLFNWLREHHMCPVCRTPCVKINLCK